MLVLTETANNESKAFYLFCPITEDTAAGKAKPFLNPLLQCLHRNRFSKFLHGEELLTSDFLCIRKTQRRHGAVRNPVFRQRIPIRMTPVNHDIVFVQISRRVVGNITALR